MKQDWPECDLASSFMDLPFMCTIFFNSRIPDTNTKVMSAITNSFSGNISAKGTHRVILRLASKEDVLALKLISELQVNVYDMRRILIDTRYEVPLT